MKAYGSFWHCFINYKDSVPSFAYFIHQQINIALTESWNHLETHKENGEILIDEYHVRRSLQLHQLNQHLIFHTWRNHTSPTYFGVSHTIFRENLHISTQNHLLLHSCYLSTSVSYVKQMVLSRNTYVLREDGLRYTETCRRSII